MASAVLIQDELEIPAIGDLDDFRHWATSLQRQTRCRVWLLDLGRQRGRHWGIVKQRCLDRHQLLAGVQHHAGGRCVDRGNGQLGIADFWLRCHNAGLGRTHTDQSRQQHLYLSQCQDHRGSDPYRRWNDLADR